MKRVTSGSYGGDRAAVCLDRLLECQGRFLTEATKCTGAGGGKLGEGEVDGRKAIDFAVKFDGGESKVTVDACTKLPVQIEVWHPSRSGGKRSVKSPPISSLIRS